MTASALKDLMLVGSMRVDTAEEALRRAGETIGDHVSFLPDGEVGARQQFIMHLAQHVYSSHPDFELASRPAPAGELHDVLRPASFKDNWRFTVKDGIERIRFGEPGWRLGYAEPAINGYFIFKTLRAQGVIPAGVRFQVTLPLAGYGCYTFVNRPEDWPKAVPGYEEALRAEIANIAQHIPPRDLVFQFDQVAVYQSAGAAGRGDTYTAAMNRERYAGAIAAIAPHVPADALLGFHLCYGGLEGWPSRRPPLSDVIDAANLVAQSAGRRIDYIHLPLLPHQDARYFDALRGLAVGTAKVYLGVIHTLDDVADLRFRIDNARSRLPAFGIAAPCGIRSYPVDDMLRFHQTAWEVLARV